jgi:carbon monoxide dehydrogenase subunit G
MIQLTREFVISAEPDEVWDYFQDIPAVAACLPGAELEETLEDGTYSGAVTFKLGPMTARFEGSASIQTDPADRSAHITGKGLDRSGGSQGRIALDYRVRSAAEGSCVEIDANITIMGAAAQIGRPGLINEIATRMVDEFVACVEARLAAPNADTAATIRAGEVKGVRLFLSSLWSAVVKWVKRLFGRDRGKGQS